MEKLYFAFYLIALVLLLLDAFAESHRGHVQVRLLPLGIAFAVLVLVIQTYKAI